MALGAAIGGIAGGLLGLAGADRQADALEGATKEEIEFLRDKFGYSTDLFESLMRTQEPSRVGAQNAMRSLNLMAGLPDPGPSAAVFNQPEFAQREDRERLDTLKDRLAGTDKFISPVGPSAGGEGPPGGNPIAKMLGIPQTRGPGASVNPEFSRLEDEIAELEAELSGGGGGGAPGELSPGQAPVDEFTGPRDITETPGYNFFVDEGLEALSASGSARGMQLSGNQMEDITQFGQGTASQFRGQLLNELRTIAGMQPTNEAVTGAAGSARGAGRQIAPLFGQQGMIGAARTAGQFGNLGTILQSLSDGFGSPGVNAAPTTSMFPTAGQPGVQPWQTGGKI